MQINKKPNYVKAILDDEVIIYFDTSIGIQLKEVLPLNKKWFRPKIYSIRYTTDNELAEILMKLQQKDFVFASDLHGWPPAAIFKNLRDKKMVSGKIKEILWKGGGEFEIFEEEQPNNTKT